MTRPLLVLGVDPGGTGAAALLRAAPGSPFALIGAACWRETERDAASLLLETWTAEDPRVRRARTGRWARVGLGTGRALLPGLLPEERIVVALETDFVGMVGGPAAVSGLVVARRAEAVVAGIDLSCAASPPVRELPSRSWRAALGWPTDVGRDRGKEIAAERAPAEIPGLADALRILGESADLCEAAGLAAAVAAIEARPESTWDLRLAAHKRARRSRSR